MDDQARGCEGEWVPQVSALVIEVLVRIQADDVRSLFVGGFADPILISQLDELLPRVRIISAHTLREAHADNLLIPRSKLSQPPNVRSSTRSN